MLENSLANEVRARKIAKAELASGKTASVSAIQPHSFITIFTAAAVIFLFFVAKMILTKRKQRLLNVAI